MPICSICLVVPEIRKKMTNLRTYYGKELWKEKKAHTNGDEGYSSRWQFFRALNFLRDNCNPRQNTKTDSLDESCTGDESESRENCKGDYLHNGDDDNRDDNSWDESNILASLTAVDDEKEDSREEAGVNSVSNEHRDTSSPVSKKIEKRKKAGGDLENVIAKLQRSSKTEYSPRVQKNPVVSVTELTSGNPDMVFAHHVGLTLMNMKNQRVKDLAKLKIQQVLYETQYIEETPQPVQAFPITALQGNTC